MPSVCGQIRILALLVAVAGIDALTVMSFNLRYGDIDDGINSWPQRKHIASAMMVREQPDIVGVQEAIHFQLSDISRALPNLQAHESSWNAIFFNTDKFAKTSAGHIWLSETPHVPHSKSWGARNPRLLTWVLLAPLDGTAPILVFNTHLDVDSSLSRRHSAVLARDYIHNTRSKFPDARVIMTGDFNTSRHSIPHSLLTSPPSALKDAYQEAEITTNELDFTYHHFFGLAIVQPWYARLALRLFLTTVSSMGPDWGLGLTGPLHIDWILVDGWKVREHSVVWYHSAHSLYPSDHFPVKAVLL